MISLAHVRFAYSYVSLFQDLSFHVEPGSVCGLLGKNGAGKTSLMKLIAGLRFADSGQLETLGFDPAERRPEMLADVFYLPEIVALPSVPSQSYLKAMAPFYPKFDRDRFDELAREFEIPDRTPLSQMSLGESRKTMLAFALAAGCRLLLLDEPANGLDIPSRKQLRKLLALAAGEDRAIIVSTHQVHDIEALIDSIAILHGGAIVLHETVEALGRRLFIGRQTEEPDPRTALFSERVAGGYMVVKERGEEPENVIDLEILFQAAIADPARIQAILEKGETHVANHWSS